MQHVITTCACTGLTHYLRRWKYDHESQSDQLHVEYCNELEIKTIQMNDHISLTRNPKDHVSITSDPYPVQCMHACHPHDISIKMNAFPSQKLPDPT
jgi:hypothetical protein